MGLKKTLAERLFRISKSSSQSLTNCRISTAFQTRLPQNSSKNNIARDPGDHGIFRRLFHKRAIIQTQTSPVMRSIYIGENLREKIRAFDISRDRIRLGDLMPPAIKDFNVSPMREQGDEGITVEDARKLLKVAQMEMVKSRLREIESSWIQQSDYVRICGESCSDPEQGIRVAKTLDESGTVIVLGNVVFLQPDQEIETLLFGKI